MKRVLLLSFALLALVSCNRFENTFGPAVETFFADYRAAAFNYAQTGDTLAVQSFYATDYNNNGLDAGQAIWLLHPFSGVDATLVEMELQRSEEFTGGVRIQYDLRWEMARTEQRRSYVDVLREEGDGYILAGNKVDESVEDYAGRFAADVEAYLLGANIILGDWFALDYYHDGSTMQNVLSLLGAIMQEATDQLTVSVTDCDPWSLDFELGIIDTSVDLDITLGSRARIAGAGYILCGNGQEEPDETRQKVFAELFTATWCVNCPQAEEALHTLKQEFGDRLLYVEYHVGDEFYSDNNDLNTWYGNGSAPTAVFQGQSVLIGTWGALEQAYRDKIEFYGAQEALAQFSGFSHTLGEAAPSGVVSIATALPQTDLYLKWALVEESATGNNGNLYHQIVTMKGQLPLDGVDLSQPVSFDFTGVESVPADAIVYLWLQTVTTDHDPAVNKIYNAIEIPIEQQ
ncbi:MAG: hypothetical protein K8R90_09315 [Candidatus Cloacimonetes bacterium]|nr:hypothetical protein [Candidatus Cloacimonadota bacterium]